MMLLTPPVTAASCSIPATLIVTVPVASSGTVTLITAFSPSVITVVFAPMVGATFSTTIVSVAVNGS